MFEEYDILDLNQMLIAPMVREYKILILIAPHV
jgi:hypothetical protein